MHYTSGHFARSRTELMGTRIACLYLAVLAPLAAQTVIVTGTYDPVPLADMDRAVRVVPARELAAVSNSLDHLLQLDPSLDLQQRAPGAIQSGLSIRGGTFGQTLVLLNGFRMNDVQTANHNLDIPLPLDSITQIEALRGSGSTMYGSDAIAGVVNLIARPPEIPEFRVAAAAGSFGTNQQRATWSLVSRRWSEQLSASRDFSAGFRENRDYRSLSLASVSHIATPLGETEVVLAHSDRPFGADRFYGNFNSWERTRGWFAAVRQPFGARTEVSLGFRRHTDLFVLYRDRPQVFTNRHAVETWQGAVRRNEVVGTNASLYYGGEVYEDSIASTNLGRHSRGRASGYVAYDMRTWRRFSVTLGAREESYRSLDHQFSPSASAGYWLSEHLKLRGSISRGFRLPTFTDLYYHDPANRGSPDLRPEIAWSFEGGLNWNARLFRGDIGVFQRRERDGIDYVRASLNDMWRAANFRRLRFTGIEAGLETTVARKHRIDVRYTGLKGLQSTAAGMLSKYTFNYPVHAAVIGWQAALPGGLAGRSRLGAYKRYARDTYAVWDLWLARDHGRLRPFIQFTNLTGSVYEEVYGVPMPGRGVLGGVQMVIRP